MAFTRVHHVGLVTGDLENARRVLVEGFGLALDEHRTPWPGVRGEWDDVTTLHFPIGEMYYEVNRPNSPHTEAARFLEATGGRGGMYYISIASDNFAADVASLLAKGVRLKGEGKGSGPVFLDPATCYGLLIQVRPEEHYYVHPHFRGRGLLTGMAHIGIAFRSLEEARHLWGSLFGLPEDRSVERRLEDPSRIGQPGYDPVHLIEFPLGGTVIEISVPLTPDSGTARLVAQRAPLGAVYHHTCPYAPDVYRFVEHAVAAGLTQIGTLPPRGEQEVVVGWFHPRTCLGMLVEVWNRPPGKGHHHPP
jgi:methylmalonyl-CoA/ethylmalonyl-CoA epimerase